MIIEKNRVKLRNVLGKSVYKWKTVQSDRDTSIKYALFILCLLDRASS